MDVKEWISHKYSGVCNLITISLSNLLLHIIQKEKIAPKIAAKFARVNGPKQSRCPERLFLVIIQQSNFYTILWFGRPTCSAKTDFKLLLSFISTFCLRDCGTESLC